MTITAEYYAHVYSECREAIRSLPGHEQDEVITAAIAPWNLESGDWLLYLFEVLVRLSGRVDGIALHGYTHGANPGLVRSNERRHGWLWHLRTYRDQIAAFPDLVKDKPLYITESNQGDDAWLDVNSGWIQEAYREIDDWNKSGGQTIRCLCLYRWAYDKWAIEGKNRLLGDLHDAMEHDYTWGGDGVTTMLENAGLEGEYTQRGAPEIYIASEWEHGYWQDPADGSSRRPEWKAETRQTGQGRVLEGEKAQKWFWTYGKGIAWVKQYVHNLTPGSWYEFSAHVWVWSSGSNHDGSVSAPPTGKMWVRLGANGWGSGDALTPSTEYGGALVDQYDKWLKLTTVFQAKASTVCVFLWASPENAVQHNDVYWDKCELKEWECAEPPEPPEPPPGPGEPIDYDRIETIVQSTMRQELDRTKLTG